MDRVYIDVAYKEVAKPYTRSVGIEVVEPWGECKVRDLVGGLEFGGDSPPSYCELG